MSRKWSSPKDFQSSTLIQPHSKIVNIEFLTNCGCLVLPACQEIGAFKKVSIMDSIMA